MKAVLSILLAAALTGVTCLAAGRIFARLARVELDRFVAFITGAAILSTCVFLITAAGVAHTGEFVGLAAVILCGGWILSRPVLRRPRFSAPDPWTLAFWIVYILFGWIYLSQAMAPETSPDGVAYHLGLVSRYFREHEFPEITTSIFASLWAAVDMLFLFAFSIGKHSAAAMVEFLFLMATPFGILAWARRAGHPVAGVVGALLFFAAPLVGRDGTIAYVDVATAAIAFALFSVLQSWRDRPSARLLVVAGVIAGFGFAAKYTQVVGALYGAGFVMWSLRGRRRELWKSAAVFGLCASFMVAPWMIKNAMTVGNPFSPFLNRWFPNPYVYPSFETEVLKNTRHPTGVTAASFPLELAVSGERLDGLIGPVLLLIPFGLLALRKPVGRQLLLAAAVYTMPAFSNVSGRFLIPALVFCCIALAVAVERMKVLAAMIVAVHTITCLPWVVHWYAPRAWAIEGTNWSAALRRIPEPDYIRSKIPDYGIGLLLRDYVPEGALVLARDMANTAYQPRELVGHWQSAFGMRMFSFLDQAMYDSRQPTRRFVYRFGERRLHRIRLVLDDCGDELWAVAEMRVFLGDSELGRNPAWRLRAWPSPWDVQFAFDGSPVTEWNARQYHPSHAFVEIGFPGMQGLDRLAADLPQDLGGCRMHVEGDPGTGRLAPVPTRLDYEAAPYPVRYRRAVIEELKANRILWMVVRDAELLAKDLVERREQWGVAPVGYSGGYRLFRLD